MANADIINRLNALTAPQPTSSRANVGDQFVHIDSSSYTERDGHQDVHEYEILWEVVEITASGITCTQVEILAERGRPTTFTPRNAPHTTRIAHFAVESYSDNGTIRWI